MTKLDTAGPRTSANWNLSVAGNIQLQNKLILLSSTCNLPSTRTVVVCQGGPLLKKLLIGILELRSST